MPRVREIEIDEVPADAQPIYRRFANEYGPFLNQVKLLLMDQQLQKENLL